MREPSAVLRRISFVAIASLVLLPPVAPGNAQPAPGRGSAWEPSPRSRPLYGTKPPSEDPDTQRHVVEAADGVDLFVETWLPAAKDGRKPPAKIPTILIMTPYVIEGAERYPASGDVPSFISYMTERGYAVAQHHVRGTGESGGCLEQTAENQTDDGARVVEYLGRDAPWSNGKVGMYGRSYDAETQLSTAGLGDRSKIRYLKAIVPIASVGSQYDWNFMDGVPWFGQPLAGNTSYLIGSMEPGAQVAPQHYPEKLTCQGEVMGNSVNVTGDYTDYWRRREYRPGARKLRAATLMVHGLRDFNVQPITLAGFFDRIPDATPHKGLFGVWNHANPNLHPSIASPWTRVDWFPMVTAWFDRFLKDLPTGVEGWPSVQVQSSDGQWWVAPEFPTTGGPVGQLALGPEGDLGVIEPDGATQYVEPPAPGADPVSGAPAAVFETEPMKAPLHLTGQPVADLWLQTNLPDGHVAVSLEVIGPGGSPATHAGGEAVATYGVRSLQHLEPMRRGWFEQAAGIPPPVDTPLRVQVRLLPTDLLVPKGSSLRLTIAGTVDYSKGTSLPSGVGATITILHDCDYMSALRFLMPAPSARLLNVREPDELDGRLRSSMGRIGRRDGGGLARDYACGRSPQRVPFL